MVINSEDGVLGGALTEPGFWLDIAATDANDLNMGFTATVTLGINSSAVSSEGRWLAHIGKTEVESLSANSS